MKMDDSNLEQDVEVEYFNETEPIIDGLAQKGDLNEIKKKYESY